MARTQWAGSDYPSYNKRSKSSKVPMLALAGLAAAAWANRDKLMAAFATLKDSATSAANAGTGSRTDSNSTAHQADGTDSSASFAAGIADEGMAPSTTGTGTGMNGTSF